MLCAVLFQVSAHAMTPSPVIAPPLMLHQSPLYAPTRWKTGQGQLIPSDRSLKASVMTIQTTTIAESMTSAPSPDGIFEFDQNNKLKAEIKLPPVPEIIPENGEFWCVKETATNKLFGPFMTEEAAQSLIDDDGIKGTLSRMTLQ